MCSSGYVMVWFLLLFFWGVYKGERDETFGIVFHFFFFFSFLLHRGYFLSNLFFSLSPISVFSVPSAFGSAIPPILCIPSSILSFCFPFTLFFRSLSLSLSSGEEEEEEEKGKVEAVEE